MNLMSSMSFIIISYWALISLSSSSSLSTIPPPISFKQSNNWSNSTTRNNQINHFDKIRTRTRK